MDEDTGKQLVVQLRGAGCGTLDDDFENGKQEENKSGRRPRLEHKGKAEAKHNGKAKAKAKGKPTKQISRMLNVRKRIIGKQVVGPVEKQLCASPVGLAPVL